MLDAVVDAGDCGTEPTTVVDWTDGTPGGGPRGRGRPGPVLSCCSRRTRRESRIEVASRGEAAVARRWAYVAVVGPSRRPPTSRRRRAVGRGLAERGHVVLCGGHGGVMEAVARGAAGVGGVVVGLLPGTDRSAANPYVTVAIPTGLGELRNALLVRSSDVVRRRVERSPTDRARLGPSRRRSPCWTSGCLADVPGRRRAASSSGASREAAAPDTRPRSRTAPRAGEPRPRRPGARRFVPRRATSPGPRRPTIRPSPRIITNPARPPMMARCPAGSGAGRGPRRALRSSARARRTSSTAAPTWCR